MEDVWAVGVEGPLSEWSSVLGHLPAWAPALPCGERRTFQKDNISAALHQSGFYDSVQLEATLQENGPTALLELAKREPKTKMIWSDETQI